MEYFGFQCEGDWIERGHPLVITLAKAHQAIAGESPNLLAFPGTTDVRSFNLYSRVAAVAYGPKGENIHAANEYVELDSIVSSAKALALFMMDWCGIGEME